MKSCTVWFKIIHSNTSVILKREEKLIKKLYTLLKEQKHVWLEELFTQKWIVHWELRHTEATTTPEAIWRYTWNSVMMRLIAKYLLMKNRTIFISF